jgi:transcriptional regulator with XRE-family HTH domain
MVIFIKDYIAERLEGGDLGYVIAEALGVSVSMVSSYKLGGYNPSLSVAKTVYRQEGIVLHPFSEESLKVELSKDKR